MADSKGKSIPQWQRQEVLEAVGSSVPDQPTSTPTAATEEAQATLREELLQQGTEWLQHEDICDAPRERKIMFLEKKGLNQPEIHRLLEASQSDSPEAAPLTNNAEKAVRTFFLHHETCVANNFNSLRSPNHPLLNRLRVYLLS